MTWSLAQVARVCGVSWSGSDVHVTGFSTDSRIIKPGEVFVALRGERFDGHDFIAQAASRGAVAAVVERPSHDLTCVIVSDALLAYAHIAAHHLENLRSGMKVVGITGSSGKTSTKDLLTHVCSSVRNTVASQGSQNNEIGLPATVLSANAETEVLILEMGMRGIGHIEYLCSIAPPDVSVVLNVGSAHLGELGSRDAIAQAKSEIVSNSRVGAAAVLNADDPRVSAMAALAHGPVAWFGQSDTADFRATNVELNADGTSRFTLHIPDDVPVEVSLQLLGAHQVGNACAVAATAATLGLSSADIVEGLRSARHISRWRMERTVREDGLVVINDAYNANPESMAAAITSLAATAPQGRTVAVLGEMLELGEQSQAEHEAIGRLTREAGIHEVIAVGRAGQWIAAGRGSEGTHVVGTVEDAIELAQQMCHGTDVVLCKASRSIAMERVGAALLAAFGTVSP